MSSEAKPASGQWLRYAVAAGASVGLYLWFRGGSTDWFSQPVLETDFDSFLVAKGEHPTGLDPKQAGKRRVKKADRGKVSGPFEDFLRVEAAEEDEEDHRNPLDFNSFLKSAKPSGTAATSTSTPTTLVQARTQPAGPLPHQARVLVMFGTEFGFSKEIAEKLCARLLAVGKYWPVLVDMAEHPDGYDFTNEQAVFMACSTQGDGVPPAEARGFCEWLFAQKAGNLSHIQYSVLALGDRSYTHFCRCGKQLDEALQTAGAQQLVARVDVHREDWAAVDGWSDRVVDALATLTLKPVGDQAGAGADTKATAAGGAHARRWGKSRPYPARVVAVEGLCAVSSKDDKNTMRIEFDLGDSGLTYLPGDALGIYPANGPQYVDELLTVLGASGSESVPTPSWHYESPQADGTTGKPTTMTLKDALALCYDIKTPKAELFQLLWQALPEAARAHAQAHAPANGDTTHKDANDKPNGVAHVVLANGNGLANGKAGVADSQAESLWSLLSGGSEAQEQYMAVGRHVVDVLWEFSAAKLTPTQVLGTLRQLQPRLYSISSAPSENTRGVQATIAEVRYQALGSDRIGVCSTYVSERLQVEQQVPVYIHKNPDFRLPASPSVPIIMVGPGTGLAPFRSFILERLLEAQTTGTTPGEMVLYFGCRRSDQDYLYGKDLEQWAAEGKITLHTAFSRQQAAKVYVQDRLQQQADAMWRLLNEQGAHFYVCGDAAHMAGAVEATLLRIIAERVSAPEGADAQALAQSYLDQLSKSGRYQRDVWY